MTISHVNFPQVVQLYSLTLFIPSTIPWFPSHGGLQEAASHEGALPTRMHSESASKLIKSLLSPLTQWTWSSSTNCILILCSVHRDKQRLSDHLIFCICSHTHTHTDIEAQMPAHDSVLRDHIDANACHVIAQAVDLRSRGWMLSCQRLIPSAFHRFFFFFPRPDFHTYPKL